eukprot:280035-Heterocapsa_arctica.AAC.1
MGRQDALQVELALEQVQLRDASNVSPMVQSRGADTCQVRRLDELASGDQRLPKPATPNSE